MPTVSKKQERFMQAVAHNPAFAKKVGVPVKVGKEFTKSGGGEMKESKAMVKKEVAFMKKKGAPKSMIKHEMKEAGMKKMASGGLAAGHKAADGIAKKGKTKGKEVKMAMGGAAVRAASGVAQRAPGLAAQKLPAQRPQTTPQAAPKQQAPMQKSAPPRGPVKQANPFGMGMSQDTSALNKIGQAKQQAPAYAQPYVNKMTSMVKAAAMKPPTGGGLKQIVPSKMAQQQLTAKHAAQVKALPSAQRAQYDAQKARAFADMQKQKEAQQKLDAARPAPMQKQKEAQQKLDAARPAPMQKQDNSVPRGAIVPERLTPQQALQREMARTTANASQTVANFKNNMREISPADFKKVVGKKAGGLAAGHKEADGIAKKGKTRAMQVKMASGGKAKKYC
jgi:hypothetical protein